MWIKLKPASGGSVIRDPDTKKILPPEGARVRMNAYWSRRLKEGSVVRGERKKSEPKMESKPQTGKGGE